MMMIAASWRAKVVVITGPFNRVEWAGVNRCVVRIPVHERWMNGRFLGVTEKLWGEPCEFKITP
jgi:hypothetical protein